LYSALLWYITKTNFTTHDTNKQLVDHRCEWVIVFYRKLSDYSAISWREQINLTIGVAVVYHIDIQTNKNNNNNTACNKCHLKYNKGILLTRNAQSICYCMSSGLFHKQDCILLDTHMVDDMDIFLCTLFWPSFVMEYWYFD
jgi:hypothetical protein